ncbi:uncharacterized protein LOC115444521 isoform X1 [Manduca sexta]|uniref:uncharacterized protein LOC115444521 isoform X1 n=1 Tax=Manduca sexta TaxID=7130 RepID=UPI001183AEB9|nr:uncharacterized protein LOC115444521 isoform X1 [Manduca sexta]
MMEGGDGMVAVVRELRDAGLAVTLLEGSRRYTLMPNSVAHPPMPTCIHVSRDVPEPIRATSEVCTEPPLRCDSSAQATDGRYASIYKVQHCNVSPTSPQIHLAEFPPQRAELTPSKEQIQIFSQNNGHGNFEVGGTGSGEKYSPVRPSTQFRGGMSWPDRGSVCAPRPSYEPDSFANSLRKYPNMSPQRSSEIVERLVNYTQAKHASKICARSRLSPTRLSECNSNHTLDRDSRASPTRHRGYEPEVTIRPKVKTDESPTREGRPKRCDMCLELNTSPFCKNFEVRCLRDMSKRTRESLKHSTGQPCYLNGGTIRDHCSDEHQSRARNKATDTTSVEIQAVVEMMSREVATLPRVEPSKRNVAVPLSPICSITQRCPEVPVAVGSTGSAFKSVQTISTNITKKTRKFVQATSSSIELLSAVDRRQCNERSGRKSKSQEEIRTRKEDFRKEMLQLLQSIDCHGDEVYQAFRDELVRKIKKNRRKLNLGIEDHAKSVPFWFKARPTCRHYVNNCRSAKNPDIFKGHTRNIGVPNDDSLQNTVKDWLREIHTKNSELLERLSLDHIVSSLAAKLRQLCFNSEEISKSEIMQMIEQVTFDASDSDRNVQLNNLADALTNKIKDVLYTNSRQFNRHKQRERTTQNKKFDYFPFRKLIQPTEEEVRGFVKEELLMFMNKFNLNLNAKSIQDVETEVIDVLIDSIDELQWGDNDKVKEEVAISLRETSQLPECYFICLADTLVKRFKSFMRTFSALNMEKVKRQTFVVLQNTVQNASIQLNEPENTSNSPGTEADEEALIEQYTSQLTQIIEAWWTSILGADENEKGFREVAINDLAGDIVDRHRFLGMNNSIISSNEEEIEYLKFQIFRWINKLVGDEAMQQALDRAPELMAQIQRIPVPAMSLQDSLVRSRVVVERPRSPVPTKSTSPAKAAPNKPGYNFVQIPMQRSASRGDSISGGLRKRGATGRRMSEPASYSINQVGPGVSGVSRGRRLSTPANMGATRESPIVPSIPKITKDFEHYLDEWITQIPIAANNPQEQERAEKLKRNIRNGVLMALAKAEIDSATSSNEFYLQDFFEEELENLLSSLPSSQELTSKKMLLKANLIERARDTIKAIINANVSTSYRYRLWDAISSSLPQRPVVDDRIKSAAHLFEEFLKLNIAEDYVLYKLHHEMDLPKTIAYKDKVLITLRKLYDNAQLLPGGDRITALDPNTFANNIYNAMVKVNVPPEDILQNEGDQIVLGHEIAQWLQDLPITQSDAHLDQLQKRRLRDSLAKKIYEIEKQTNLCDNSAMRQVKNELTKFLEKFSPRPEEAGNLSFLIDEFINRLKNRRKIVHAPTSFPWFFKQVPFSSSFVDHSGPISLIESLDDPYVTMAPAEAGRPSMVGADLLPQALPVKEPTSAQWLTLLNTQEQLQRDREAREAQSQQIPPCCQPATHSSLSSQPKGGHLGQYQQVLYQDPPNVQQLTMIGTQERIEREKKALEAQAQSQQIPSCCQPAGAPSPRAYGSIGPGVVGPTSRNLHTRQIAGTTYESLAGPRRQFGASPAAPSTQSEMRRLVDLQDQRLSMMQSAIPAVHPGPSGVASFVPSQAQPVIQMPTVSNMNGIFSTSQMAGPSGVAGSNLAKPKDPTIGGTPLMQRSVRPRQIGSPQHVTSSRSPTNQSQLQFAAPLAQEEAVFTPRHDLEDISEQNISRPVLSLLDMSNQPPVGFSTPRQSLAGRPGMPELPDQGNIPGAPRARRKRTREGDALRADVARRRLDLEEVEEEEERERDEVQCRCTERVYRCRRRRPMCCDCEDMDYPRYFPMPYPYCFY